MHKGNMGNMTNNKLESINGQIKTVLKKYNRLTKFCEEFFTWLSSHNMGVDIRTANQFMKKSNDVVDESLAIYKAKLTDKAFELVKEQHECSEYVDIIEKGALCTFTYRKTEFQVCKIYLSTTYHLKIIIFRYSNFENNRLQITRARVPGQILTSCLVAMYSPCGECTRSHCMMNNYVIQDGLWPS